MINCYTVLKKAFIEAEQEQQSITPHEFSRQFKANMQKIIKSQKSVIRFVNTTGKRVACVVFIVLICLTSVACSIKEVREPIIEEIQKFFVNARQLIDGTAADDISEYFPTDVTKIIATSYISEAGNQYIIDEENKVKEFIRLLCETNWGESEWFNESDEINAYWSFEFFDAQENSVLQIQMCNDVTASRSRVAIIQNGAQKRYLITNKVYREILAFTNKKYYLHDSSIEHPKEEFCIAKRTQVLIGLDDQKKKQVKSEIRNAHYKIESFLLGNVSDLKETDSIYWKYVLNGEEFVDPITDREFQYTVYEDVISSLESVLVLANDKQVREDIGKALILWKNSMSEHDLEGLFTVHEYVHDYDYFLFNYPTRYVYDEDADYQGINDYFGHLRQTE